MNIVINLWIFAFLRDRRFWKVCPRSELRAEFDGDVRFAPFLLF